MQKGQFPSYTTILSFSPLVAVSEELRIPFQKIDLLMGSKNGLGLGLF
jgi:hypothetical protein